MNPMKSYISIINEAQQNNAIYEEFHRVGTMMVEYKLTPDQITQVFQQVQAGASAAGGNRTMIGKGVDAASAVSKAFDTVKAKIASSGPVAGFDEKFAGMQQKLTQAAGGESGPVVQALRQYQQFAKAHPVMQGVIYSGLIALAGLSGAGLGAAAILGGVKMFDKLLQGDKFSSSLWQGFKTGATSAAAGAIGAQSAAAASDAAATQDAAAASDQGNIGSATSDAAATQDAAAASDQGNIGSATSDAAATQDAAAASDAGNLGGGAPNKEYTVKRGDTLSAIAQKNKISVADLMKANPEITNPNVIGAGQNIQVPAATGNSIYQGGVGTASDTAKKVASGIYKAAPKPRLAADKWSAGFQVVGLPLSEMIDVNASMQQNALMESTGDMSLVLTEVGVGAVLYNIAAYNQYLIEADRPGIFSRIGTGIKNAAGAVGKKLGTMAGNVTTKVTADKLQRAWSKAGSPKDSRQLMSWLQQQGIDKGIVMNVYKGLNIPTQTGGRVKGAGLSQTAGAIRKRTTRAAAKASAAPATMAQPMSTGGTATANLGQVGGQTKPRVNIGRAATQDAPGFKRDVSQLDQQPTVTKEPRAAIPKRLPPITVGKEKIQSIDPRYASLAKAMKGKTMQAAGYDNPGKLIAEARGLMKLAEFAPTDKKDMLIAEAANAAQQAAIAISMKKNGKKPKKDEAVQPGQFVEPSGDAKQQIKANNQQSADKAAIGRAEMGIMPVDEEEKKGLYYYVNKRKKAGTSRSKNNPKAPSEQDWKNAAKIAKK